MDRTHEPVSKGFTLVELLIVIAIVAVLALLGFMGASRFIENGKKVQAMAQFRDFDIGMTMFIGDYQKPPIPQSKRDTGWDTIYGDPDGTYANQFLVSVLAGEDKDYPARKSDETFSAKSANPRGEPYMIFPFSAENKNGVGKDGSLYDPWGREVIDAINGYAKPGATLVPSNTGENDSRLYTWGLAEYTDTKPSDQAFVLWSYGKDGKKGKGGAAVGAIVQYAGSGDVKSW